MSHDSPPRPAGSPGGGQWREHLRAEGDVDLLDGAGGDPTGTWAVDYEDVEWTEPPEAGTSRRQRLLARGAYRASVPPFITGLDVDVDPGVQAEAAEAAAELVRFDAEVSAGLGEDGEVSPLASVLLRSESASSSQIEQITAGARALALASIGEKAGPNAALVTANTDAMTRALALSDAVSAEAIVDVQTALLAHSAPEHAARFRARPVWIGGRGSTPHSASFVPPVSDRVPALIDDLVTFTQRTDISPFVQVAVAHAQFETIHPFPDGNGRTGRALAHAMLRNYRITRRMTVPVSAGLLANVEDYYGALGAYRGGDLNPIVSVFTQASFDACENGRTLVGDLRGIRADWGTRVNARRHAAVWNALPVVMSQPAVTVNHLAEHLSISFPAAQRAVEAMVEADILSPVGTQKRNRVWTANEVLGALDDFAARVGRRKFSG